MSTWLLVLAGGSGTRFWPRSRANHPKQLIPIVGDDPLLVVTLKRFAGLVPEERSIVLTTEMLVPEVEQALSGMPKVEILAEPESRNTAPCIVMAMEWVRARDPDATVILVPSDHWITDVKEYAAVMKRAAEAAAQTELLYTIGIPPTRPETGFGYIRSGDRIGDEIYKVDRFVEKPAKEVAETMVQRAEYFWNAGMFVWSVKNFFRELAEVAPEYSEVFRGLRAALRSGTGVGDAIHADYGKAPANSIDYALLEKSKRVAVLPGGSFGWNDLGSFVALEEIYPSVEGGAARAKQVLAIDSLANIVDAPGKTVALLGITDLIIVDAGDVLLVAAKERAQDVKRFVERLKKSGQKDLI